MLRRSVAEEGREDGMTNSQIFWIRALLITSVLCLILPILIGLIRRNGQENRAKYGLSKMILFSGALIGSIWCLRYAVGCYTILSAEAGEVTLSWWEEIFNSLVHALQTFSMDEDYTSYLLSGKEMVRMLVGVASAWEMAYSAYASLLNFVAPIAGGAIILDILVNVFPQVRLRLSNWAFWQGKYYFSALNEASLTLATDICRAKHARFSRPILVFANAYASEEEEGGAEMLSQAKRLGAICVREDLAHIAKSKRGERKFFLMGNDDAETIGTLMELSDTFHYKYLKNAEIFLFTKEEYTQVEKRFIDKLKEEYHFSDAELPIITLKRNYRQTVTELLDRLPLYEPLMYKEKKQDGSRELCVTILGTGDFGMEMFLETYWFGQILDTDLIINVVSEESEDAFWGKVDYINPEIRRTTVCNDPILKVNQKGDFSKPYATVRYLQCDVRSPAFLQTLSDFASPTSVLDTDYFMVALGTDEKNAAIAELLCKNVGRYHVAANSERKSIIAYVICDSKLSEILNRKTHFCFAGEKPDVYMQAFGSTESFYSVKNVFMAEHNDKIQQSDLTYQSSQSREERAKAFSVRHLDDYKYWANRARTAHLDYKVFSFGLAKASVFDTDGTDGIENAAYNEAKRAAREIYIQNVKGRAEISGEDEKAKRIQLLHRMAWLEHRRWNAFTRVMGFRHSDDYAIYAKQTGSYKNMELRLHPCLVECDEAGIRAVMDEKGNVDEKTIFTCEERSKLDLLDELSYDLLAGGYNSYDFKIYDYPKYDV